ncbi:MAG: hypothetical protein GWN00_04925 [Aliifodinibius sp.]|nr:hypothetical protein [Fodinibius sp.]NIV10551.1 hypothetical protein [Fodinibius sp.]NIY24171.1 hypothetical protein [Fodinibius sp.]
MKAMIGAMAIIFSCFLALDYCKAECIGTCGDANNDGEINVSDAVLLINFVFGEGSSPIPVVACGDANNDEFINVSDAIYIINFVFVQGNSPADCSFGSPNWGGQDCCPFPKCEYFPLEIGNYWVYSHFGDSLIWMVMQRQGNVAQLSISYHDNPIIVRDRGDELDIELADGNWGLYYRFLPESIWIHRDFWECNDSTIVEVIPEIESIITPAGVFHDCLRIERNGPDPCMDAGTITEWWALNVGLVKRIELTIAGPVIMELLDYSVQSK